ncbi:MAG: DEAD/DEAH box helicase [Candidatus Nitrosopelagicus sp.]|nr:DEAD/DEAH box helicase [Candidatus Nitrosopelagicus sp.]
MKISKLDLEPSAIDFLTSEGFEKLYEPQAYSVDAGILDGTSVLVSAPTASGKTLIAMLGMLAHLPKHKSKIVYLSPLRALAAEKFTEFKKLEKINLGRKIKVGISTGDFDSVEDKLENSDILVLTNEKMDALMRFGQSWISEIGLVIVDEIHLIGDEGRGPTLEMVLTRLKSGLIGKIPQIIALSATITNSDELAEWLDCEHVESTWRPVPLSEAVYDDFSVTNQDRETYDVSFDYVGSSTIGLGVDSVKNGGQGLLFANTRTSAAKLAVDSGPPIEKILSKDELNELLKISKKILANNEHTQLVKKLAFVVKQGVAFHHAGLNQKCREIIETEFRSGKIKLLSATPTLAAGVNLPARRVVISSVLRYNSQYGGNVPISVLEYKQLCGRAGRPQYDDEGESIIIGKNNQELLLERYVDGEPEPIESKIITPRSLRIHLLSLIVTSPSITEDKINEFFSETLGGTQTEDDIIELHLENAKTFLLDEEFISENDGGFLATRFGQKVSRLYIDPMTARDFRNAIEYDIVKGGEHTFGFLHLVTTCDEFYPTFDLRQKDLEKASIVIENNRQTLIRIIEEEDCSRSLLALDLWTNEGTEVNLSEELGIESGDMHRMAETAEWLVYSLRELSREFRREDLVKELDVLRKRIVYGIKHELIDLVRIRNVGRVRARILYKNGYKNRTALKKVPLEKLAEIDKIGMTIAKSIKSQVEKVR